MEPANLWEEYLDPEFRDRAIRIETNDGIESLIIGEEVVLQGVLAGLGGANLGPKQAFVPGKTYSDGCPPASYEPKARAEMLDEWGVQMGVLFPTIGILPFPTEDNKLANAYCRAYNRWQTEFAAAAPNRVVPIATVNWCDVEEAAKELDHCIAAGFKGLFVPPEPIGDYRPGATKFDPIWSRCEEAGLPGCFHVIVRFSGSATGFSAWGQGAERTGPVFTFAMGATGQLIPAMASVVLDGLFDRFPKLKIVSVEAGCGYAPYLMHRLEEKFNIFGDLSPLKLKPSEYIQRNCYFVAEPEELNIDSVMDIVGEDNVLWGSDYPHIDSRLDAPQLIHESIGHLSPERKAKVLGENARSLFQL